MRGFRLGHRRFNIAAYLLVLVALCDQLSKWCLLREMSDPPQAIPVNDYFNLVLVWNRGVTFGLLNNMNHTYMSYFLVAVALLILYLLGRWLWTTTSTPVSIGLGAIMGGAIGNIIDRLRYGSVVDFLDFHYQNNHWFAFNIADAAICTGVGLLLLDSLLDSLVRGR